MRNLEGFQPFFENSLKSIPWGIFPNKKIPHFAPFNFQKEKGGEIYFLFRII